ncbi:MAG: 30S ribosomal protein S13 [Elusimicrobiales bacterium]|nr:30S ribosomal protein S13 [Elusimicrobiales bacterium]
MARIVGLDLPRNKRIDIALTYVFGIGNTLAKKILKELGNQVDPSTRVRDLTEEQTGLINSLIIKEYRVEGELRREISQNLKRYIEIGSYRGIRHRRSLPSRGQRTKTNGRTRRGRRKTIGSGGGK